jgi:hypothetical protein
VSHGHTTRSSDTVISITIHVSVHAGRTTRLDGAIATDGVATATHAL